MLATDYSELRHQLARFIPARRLVTDPLRRLAWGTDASFYRLVPQIVVVVEDELEVRRVLECCARLRAPVTFRGAGTSLSGQAVTDSVLMLLGDGWRKVAVSADALSVTLQPGVLGTVANRRLAPHGRKIGPDPASIDAATIGGIAANNASGMCCGTGQNSYHTLAGLRLVLADGTVLDTRDPGSRAAFASQRPDLVAGLAELGRATREDATLAARIRHKFRLKNTTGYSLNALVDFTDPVDILAHLMIGSEGTLGFISEITYLTVEEHPHKASALILFDHLETACSAVTRLKSTPVAAVELLDRASLRSVQDKPGMPESLRALPADGAGLLVEARAATAAALDLKVAAIACPARVARAGDAAPLHDRRGRIGRLVERAQGHVSGDRRDATDRHDGDHRGRRLSRSSAWPRPRSPCSSCCGVTATTRPSSTAMRSKATCTSSSRRTSAAPKRWSATAASWTRCARWSSTTTTAR
jgi:D-lactate dehydrogenase